MKCPFCGYPNTKVQDSRSIENGLVIRRRRMCPKCGAKFTTYERFEGGTLMVIKKDGRREKFSREKLMGGIVKACEKRPISMDKIEEITNALEARARKVGTEISTKEIGEMIMKELRKIDQVAYVRFASVYRDFRDIDQFIEEIGKLKGDKDNG
ncbi:transcriptional regulator NrdR [Mesoaciditoga lauensis]|uniref:transcriptional regulator NrdR n=1 Tax=Mesoaciditoga lauensis TaxID=1495039 RepID=UPI00056505AE|nr:transcriptional regulator NrdR [Mesoaciditoga lauensis]